MAHSFEVHQLPNNVTIMACKCGATYRYSAASEAWMWVPFKDRNNIIDPPVGRCGTDGEQEQQREEGMRE